MWIKEDITNKRGPLHERQMLESHELQNITNANLCLTLKIRTEGNEKREAGGKKAGPGGDE